MIIVAGRLRVAPGARDRFVAASRRAVELARELPACLDFVVAADPLDRQRVNVYERWTDAGAMRAFRGDGPDDGLADLIVDADVREFAASPIDRR